MADDASRKLIVEVCNARNLMPKNGQGTANSYVIVDFNGQRRRTKTKFRDLNPQWDEKMEFVVHNRNSTGTETLELNLYNDKNTGNRSTFLGKLKLSVSSFAKSGSEALIYYPLEKRSVFSQIKGEIGLKVYYVGESSPTVEESDKDGKSESTKVSTTKQEEKKDGKKEEKNEEKKEEETAEKTAVATEEEKKLPDKEKSNESASESVEKPPIAEVDQSKQNKNNQFPTKISLESTVNELKMPIIERSGIAHDIVQKMNYLFVRVLKAKRADADKDSQIYAKLVISDHNVKTKNLNDADWDQVFAFHMEGLNFSSLEVPLYSEKKSTETETVIETSLGSVNFDLQEIPRRVPPDSPLAPQWYTLEGSQGNSQGNDIMLAVWIGTQVDEAFREAWQSDSGGLLVHTRAKAYLSPKLWYLRLSVIQTQDLQLQIGSGSEAEAKSKITDLIVKAQLGLQTFKTSKTPVGSPFWDEDLVFVAAEPFEPFLVITVEDASSGTSLGYVKVQISSIDRRTDDQTELRSRWFNLIGGDDRPYTGRIHIKACLEGGYHVLDEAANLTSDVRAASKQLCNPPIGMLELGICGAINLLPMKTKDGTRGTTDAFVVAKYGRKWIRTRTILDRYSPSWNEQYSWDVYDPCTVLTVGVFDNGKYKLDSNGKPGLDVRIGKIRIRLSTLDTNRTYLNSYTLTVLQPTGARKIGEIVLAVRFTCSSWLNLIQAYGKPMLPRMHYVRPLGPAQQDLLRHSAMGIVATRLARSEPPLSQEVVQYMLDSDIHIWSMRRSKANWFRVLGCLSQAAALARWTNGIRTWRQPFNTVLVHVLLVVILLCPHLVLPTGFMYMFFILTFRYRHRPRVPANMDPRLSHVDSVGPDELDEEFDGFPTSRPPEVLRLRYDRLRSLAGRAQTLLGDAASQGERLEALFNWRDPRATGIFVLFCLAASLLFYIVPLKLFLLFSGFYYLRHPRFRDSMPSIQFNFFRRLPSSSDRIL